jgi:predicted 2-oxoglutarate/Fe(II)-dependent dioxygenase YbiX/peroxiredoxin
MSVVQAPARPAMLEFGEAMPHFRGIELDGTTPFNFDGAAGRAIVFLVLGSGAWGPSAQALTLIERYRHLLDDDNACLFGITMDPADVVQQRVRKQLPGIRWFMDQDARIASLLGAVAPGNGATSYTPHWLLIDPTLRVVERQPITEGRAIFERLERMIAAAPEQNTAPVLTVPRVLDPGMCRHLIQLYEEHGGQASGFMRQEGGTTVAKQDHRFKRRSDYIIDNAALRETLRVQLVRRLLPQIEAAFQFRATRIERWIVACYDGVSGGFFRPHRDNTTTATAHRKFACTINLNAEEFDGGELRFPEYGARTYRAPTGGAVIFSCSLLHEALPVTRGRRFAFLPFFYDEAAAQLREQNSASLSPDLAYRAQRA